jgi:glutathionyl-hydroquinone reductase
VSHISPRSSSRAHIFAEPVQIIGAQRRARFRSAYLRRRLELRAEIGGINSHIYANLNNGVYEAGFAASQAAYHTAVDRVFDTLEWLPVTTALSVR